MGLSIDDSSWVLSDAEGAAEVVFDINFTEMTNQTLSAGVNAITGANNIFVTLVDSPPFVAIVNGEGLSARCVTGDQVLVNLDLTGAINAGKAASDPGRFDPRDRLRIVAEFSGTTITGAGANGDGFYIAIGNGMLTEIGSGEFSGTPISTDAAITAIHIDSNNGNKLTPRIWSKIEGTYTEKDYTGTNERAVTTGHTYVIQDVDVRQGSCWARYKTGSNPMAPYSVGLPTPDDLTTFGRSRLDASSAVAIASDHSPFTGSVIANVVFWAPVTAVSASLTRIALLRYGYVK